MSASGIKFLTQDEVAKLLRRSVKSVARLRDAGELAWLPGSPILIPETEVQAYLDRQMITRRTPPQNAPVSVEARADALVAKLKRSGGISGLLALRAKTRNLGKGDKL